MTDVRDKVVVITSETMVRYLGFKDTVLGSALWMRAGVSSAALQAEGASGQAAGKSRSQKENCERWSARRSGVTRWPLSNTGDRTVSWENPLCLPQDTSNILSEEDMKKKKNQNMKNQPQNPQAILVRKDRFRWRPISGWERNKIGWNWALHPTQSSKWSQCSSSVRCNAVWSGLINEGWWQFWSGVQQNYWHSSTQDRTASCCHEMSSIRAKQLNECWQSLNIEQLWGHLYSSGQRWAELLSSHSNTLGIHIWKHWKVGGTGREAILKNTVLPL